MVSQDCVLFARSVRENIKYGCEDASDEEMYKAAKLASAHDFIMELSNGYDTGFFLEWILRFGSSQGFLSLIIFHLHLHF